MADITGIQEELYITIKSGTFFKITRGDTFNAGEDQAEILTEEKAREFMDKHTGGIIRENYIAVFGEPEIG
ncbi:MAG: hypothetical protein LUE87_09375 [Lachnospiraceae bacterium]|nr:hypothetical protein [Lachnospiraceae bacterium]